MENKQQVMLQHGLKWGLITAMTNTILYFGSYAIDKSLLVSFAMSLFIMAVSIVLLVIPVIQFRKELGGYITFTDAFMLCLIIFAGSSLIVTVFQFILFNIIDPQLADFIKESTIEKTAAMMEKFGASDEEVEKAITPLQEQDFNMSPKRLTASYFTGLLFGAFVSTIVAAILRKRPKLDDSIQ